MKGDILLDTGDIPIDSEGNPLLNPKRPEESIDTNLSYWKDFPRRKFIHGYGSDANGDPGKPIQRRTFPTMEPGMREYIDEMRRKYWMIWGNCEG